MSKTFIYSRTQCPVCETTQLPGAILPHKHLPFPLLPVCVDTPQNQDEFAPFSITICEKCGLIQLVDVADPVVLYKIFHSDGIGKVWEEHYEKFSRLIFKYHTGGSLLEIGSGQGKLMKKLLEYYQTGMEVIDPQYEGPKENVVVHPTLLNAEFALQNKNKFSAVVSSHTLEHFIDFNDYFRDAWQVLTAGGLLFTSVPNQESNFAKGYGNQLNFEHPSICTNAHWQYLHYKNGFEIKELSFFKDHSVQIVAKKVEKPIEFNLDVKELSLAILKQYEHSIQNRIKIILDQAKPNKQNWIFGASNFTQPLFVYGLEEKIFTGVMDNSPLKHNKRLYGTSLICRKPEEVLKESENLRIFLNIGQYNIEVQEQLLAINKTLELIML
jgi:SAM-dependent methyltransferase